MVAATALAISGCSVHEPPPVLQVPAASTFDAEHSSLVAANPKGVTFRVATERDRTRFAEGEPIVIELRFTSSVADAYELDLATYDRSGRLWSESFQFDKRESIVDPLADYFGARRGGLGGLRPMPKALSSQPTSVSAFLNEWVRFAGPGRYRFFVQSTRVLMTQRGDAIPMQRQLGVASDNVLDLEIVLDPAWADKELARVKAILESGGDEDTLSAARRSLRFLTTPAAARAMVDDLCRTRKSGDEYRWQSEAGLYGSPDRTAVIAMLDEGLRRPDCAVSARHLDLLMRLSMVAVDADAQSVDDHARTRDPLVRELIAALPGKSDEARPLSLFTALGAVSERQRGAGVRSAEADELRARLAEVLGKLPDAALQSLLADQWALLRSPSIAPALLAVAGEARPRGGMLRSISDLALERLVEVDYAGARIFILSELGRGARTSFSGATLSLLRDAELPSLDGTFIAGLNAPERDGVSLELRAEVFARYASKAAVEPAWVAYRAIPYFRVSLLAYLARNDPKRAEAEIRKLPDFDSLQRLSRHAWIAPLEAAVVAKLNAPDARQAADLLADRGSAAVEKALWSRLESLPRGKDRHEIAEALRRAIMHGTAWMTPPDRLRALGALCDDESCNEDVARAIDRWGQDGTHPVLVLWSVHPSGGLTGWMGHYDIRSASDLHARMDQLKPGITLLWGTKPEDVDVAVMADIQKHAGARRIAIVPGP